MELEEIYENLEIDDVKQTCGNQTQNDRQDAQQHGGSRCLVLMTVILGLVCVLLLVFITLRETQLLNLSHKNTLEEFNETINHLQSNYSELMIEKDDLQNRFNTLHQKKLELDTRVSDLTVEKGQLHNSFLTLNTVKVQLEARVKDLNTANGQLQGIVGSLSLKKLELETELRKLSGQGKCELFVSTMMMSWSDSRQFCRDRGADLVIINTEEKQRFISSFVKDTVWIGLSDIESEGNMKWVDNLPLNQGFWEINEPNNAGNEDCVELNPKKSVLNNWNDIPCLTARKFVCGI